MKCIKYWLVLLGWAGVIFYLSGLPAQTLAVRMLDRGSSYLGHFLEYMILGMLAIRAFESSFPGQGRRNFLYAGSFSFLFALSDEFHQSFVPTRFCSAADVLVDNLGVITSFFLFFIWRKYHKVETNRCFL